MSVLPPLRIRVRLFAMQRATAGTRELRLEVPLGATVDDAWDAVVAVVPALAPGRPSLRFAVNGDYADPDRTLADGDEVACIPPVSGGSGEQDPAAPLPDEPRRILEIRGEPFGSELAAELADSLATDEDGGVVVFLGRTRVTPGTPAPGQEAEAARHAGREVEGLEYEAFEPMALGVLAEIADEIETRFGVHRVAIVHRTGAVPLGDTSVLVVAVAAHRGAAFEAARYAIDETKARAPIWKAERFADGVVWIGDVARTGPPDPSPDGLDPSRYAAGAGRMALATARGRHTAGMQLLGDGTALEDLGERATAIAAAWCATAATFTTVGQERAVLRLFGIGGLDRAGRPLAAEVVGRYLAPDPRRLGGGIALPFAMAMAEYDLRPQELALEVAAGNVDLGLEAELLAEPDRRAIAVANASALARSALERVDANRVARVELLGLLGDPARPWIGMALASPAIVDALDEARRAIEEGVELIRVDVPPSRELAEQMNRAGRPVDRWHAAPSSRGGLDAHDPGGPPIPTGAQRALAVLRRFVDEAGARRRGYVRLMTDAQHLAAPDQAVVAAFERIDVIVADPMREIVAGRVDPDRALADHVFAHRLLARAGTRVLVPAGPLLVAPDLARGVPSDPATRAGRALAMQLLGVALARRDGLPPSSVAVEAFPDWLIEEPGAPARVAAEVALRRALLPHHPVAFVEPAPAGARSATWHALVAAILPDAGDVEVVLRQAIAAPADAIAATRAAASVAMGLRVGRSSPILEGAAAEHASRAVSAAAATLAALDDAGWRAIVDQPLAFGAQGLGADAVAERTEAFDALSVDVGASA